MAPRFRLGFLTHLQGRGDPATTYRNAQELFVVADELGFDVGWVAQHHAAQGGGGLSSPWTFLSYAAARTRRLRLGTAITVLPLENPVRLAEDVSVADMSDVAGVGGDGREQRERFEPVEVVGRVGGVDELAVDDEVRVEQRLFGGLRLPDVVVDVDAGVLRDARVLPQAVLARPADAVRAEREMNFSGHEFPS
jgi:hypothetical protein